MGVQCPCRAPCGDAVRVKAVPWSLGLCCWARVSSASNTRRVCWPSIALQSMCFWAMRWDLNPAGVGAGQAKLLLLMAAEFQGCGSAGHEQFSLGETPGAVLGSWPMVDTSAAPFPGHW